jgi:type II secretory pathway component GspD/PulD (secretin)
MRIHCSSARPLSRAALSAPVLALILLATSGVAQDAKPDAAKPPMTYQTFYLHHAVEQDQAREIVSVLQNELQRSSRINYVAAQNAISLEATEEDMAAAQKIIADLDRPIATWKLTYTITQTENGQAQGTPQHVTVIVSQGSRTHLSLGNKVPIVTGSTGHPSDGEPETQVQYLDLGLNVEAKIDGASDTPLLETKVEQSSVAEERSGIGTQDPLIHQTRLDEVVNVAEGKTVTIGTLDLPGSTKEEKIEVTAERVRE